MRGSDFGRFFAIWKQVYGLERSLFSPFFLCFSYRFPLSSTYSRDLSGV